MNYDELTPFDFWNLEDQLRDILRSKGYSVVNFDFVKYHGKLTHCLECEWYVAEKLAHEISRHGYTTEIMVPSKRRYRLIFIKNTYPVELLSVAESFTPLAEVVL